MLTSLSQAVPLDAAKLVLVLFLSFLIGLEREEHKLHTDRYAFGGVRTFPLIGLIGYALAVVASGSLVPVTAGFVVIGAFLVLSYWHKLKTTGGGVTTEMSALATYVVGALVYADRLWLATALAVASALLLELKTALDRLTRWMGEEEILTFTKFLLLTAVILPLLPDTAIGPFQINPFHTWLIVVAVSTLSYGSYVLQRLTKGAGGVLLTAVLGGAYSSTVTTVALARRAATEKRPHVYAGGILAASGIMYLRLVALVALFNQQLVRLIAVPFLGLAGVALGVGWLWTRRNDTAAPSAAPEHLKPANPLALGAAFGFALLFLVLLVATHEVLLHLGQAGVYGLAGIMGVTDVDPFIMGLTQSATVSTPATVAASGILIAAASNNLVKGIYACSLADRPTGRQSFALLAALALLGLVPLLWIL
ncbi:MAG: MgtC/SapB family protein [Acidobacteriota bacterium]|nr:MgtC/SapB family protein [Acidobacteriota bacterium]